MSHSFSNSVVSPVVKTVLFGMHPSIHIYELLKIYNFGHESATYFFSCFALENLTCQYLQT